MEAGKRKLVPAGSIAPSCVLDEHARRQARAAPSDDDFRRAAALLRAAGDVTRLRLLARLAEGELCVSELAEGASVSLPAISQQLSALRAAQIVTHRRAGRHIYYALHDAHVVELVANALAHAAEEIADEV